MVILFVVPKLRKRRIQMRTMLRLTQKIQMTLMTQRPILMREILKEQFLKFKSEKPITIWAIFDILINELIKQITFACERKNV